MGERTNVMSMPCVYLNHGGGPFPLMGRYPGGEAGLDFLRNYIDTLPVRPKAILMVTAHWETENATVTGGLRHPLLFDYSGFPKYTYEYTHDAPGSPELAQKVQSLLSSQSISCDIDTQRGWDHGVFVPLKLMDPSASIPVVALSLVADASPEAHIHIGEALRPLRDEDVLIVGSGASFHNFKYIFAKGHQHDVGVAHSVTFDNWLQETMTSKDITNEARMKRLAKWYHGPSARECQPAGADEHMTPLCVVLGAGGCGPARSVGAVPGVSFAHSQFEYR